MRPELRVPAPPQLHSHDRLLRMQEGALFAIVLEHVCTVQDLSVLDHTVPWHRGARSAGITEWQADHAGRIVSIGWDWVRLQDGALVAATSVAPRSNILLVDRVGYDLGRDESDAALWRWIHTLHWQPQAAQAVFDLPRFHHGMKTQ
jgi:hypothetical protein